MPSATLSLAALRRVSISASAVPLSQVQANMQVQLTFWRPRRNFMALAMEEQQAAISAYRTRSVGSTSTPVADETMTFWSASL
jgi:hypothetical protein